MQVRPQQVKWGPGRRRRQVTWGSAAAMLPCSMTALRHSGQTALLCRAAPRAPARLGRWRPSPGRRRWTAGTSACHCCRARGPGCGCAGARSQRASRPAAAAAAASLLPRTRSCAGLGVRVQRRAAHGALSCIAAVAHGQWRAHMLPAHGGACRACMRPSLATPRTSPTAGARGAGARRRAAAPRSRTAGTPRRSGRARAGAGWPSVSTG